MVRLTTLFNITDNSRLWKILPPANEFGAEPMTGLQFFLAYQG
jgi:hypothetical protein